MAEKIMNIVRKPMIRIELLSLLNPKTEATKILKRKAQRSELQLRIPAKMTLPIGKVNSQPRSQQIETIGVATKPKIMSRKVVMALKLAEFSQRHRIAIMKADPRHTTPKIILCLSAFLVQMVKRLAPTVPVTIMRTPLMAISRSVYPQTLMMKLKLIAKQIKEPQPSKQPAKNIHRFLSFLI